MVADLSTEVGLMVPEPMKIKVGEWYELIWTGEIVQVKVVKLSLYNGTANGAYISKPLDKGFGREVVYLSSTDLKERLIVGGLKEAVII
jgi:hypothetical protein